jgi:muconolactone D-isomerase
MLFQVQMEVKIPAGLAADRFEALKVSEQARAEELQRSGKWRHLWRVVGQYRNVSVFDVGSSAELHDIIVSLPLFPYMEITVTALCRHPSSIHDDDQ